MALSNQFPILVAEDDNVSRKILEKSLVEAGYEVESVENGRQALKKFEEKFFPIVLSDWMMPEMDGFQLCQALREKIWPGYIFIVLLTGKDAKEDVIAGLGAGADDYLTKPFNQAELIARLNTGRRFLELEQSLRQANEKIRILSITDPLTGCFNRGYMNECLVREVKRSRRYERPLSVVLCDIDHFKTVNDTFGHQAGDQVLINVVQSINEVIRSDVDWLARYGGEEFLLVLPETDAKSAILLAERIREQIYEKPTRTNGAEIGITASFGVGGIDIGIQDNRICSETMIAMADKYLYVAKQEGKNRVKGVSN